MEPLDRRRRFRPWLWALLASLAVHAGLFWWLGRTVPAPPAAVARSAPIEVTIEDLRPPKPTARPDAPAAAPAAAPARKATPHRTGFAAAKPAGAASQGSSSAPAPLSSAPMAAAPPRLDLTYHQPLEPVMPGGETIRNAPGEMPPKDTRSLAQSRIDAWIDDDSARRRVNHGMVDDWFVGLRRSLDAALAKSPPPTEALHSVAQTVAQDYLRQAEAFGKGGNPTGVNAGPQLSDSSVDHGAVNDALGHPGTFSLPLHNVSEAGLWAVVELDYDLDGQLKRSRLVQSSGNGAFNQHVLKVVALGLPGLTSPPDAGLGIHPDGTRSLWEIDGHLTFDRDVRQLGLKDAWYLPVAAATALLGGSFDETTGYVGYADFRHPHLTCDAKLLGVY